MQTFGRGVLNVAHVEIKPAAVQKKAAVARRFFVIAIVKIDRPGARLVKEIILYFGRPHLGVTVQLFAAQQAAIFGFDSNDAIHRLTSIRQTAKIDNLELEEHALLCSISEKNGGVRAAAVSSDCGLTCVIMRLSPNRVIRSSCST